MTPAAWSAWLDLITALPGPVVFPVHPRTRARLQRRRPARPARGRSAGVELTEPLGYIEFSALLRSARAVLTDSGGVQKEAYLARVPCVTLRANTEWVETVDAGWNTLVDLDAAAALDRAGARAAGRASRALRRRPRRRALRAGDRGAVSEQDTVRVGVVGLGYWGPNLARNFAAIPGCEVSWLCDASEPAREKLARSFPGARTTAQIGDLLADESLDAVVLATPVPTHAELAVAVAQAGKHCFVEKPLATTPRTPSARSTPPRRPARS